jgi:nucleoporin GLE1
MLNYFAHVMAIKFIEMAEKQISLHPPSAYPYGQVVADLIGNIPAFKLVLMANLFTKCPCIVPRYPPRLEGQSDHEYKLTLGYKEIAPGQTEDEATYTERMCGLISFYAAIVQSIPLRPNSVNPYDIKFGWIWVASILNMRPRPITPYVLASFFDIAGYSMFKAYGPNFLSIMEFLQHTFLPMVPSVSIAAKTRLKIFVEDTLENRRVKEPEGLHIDGINYDLIEQQRKTAVAKASGSPVPSVNTKPLPPLPSQGHHLQQPSRFGSDRS